jgi:hypothetical protein
MTAKRERLCAYGDCHETTVLISLNYRNEERPTFCCEAHAIKWLQYRQAIHERNRTVEHKVFT